MKTFIAKPNTINRKWYLVDARDKTLGRLASQIAFRLRGKHKPEFTPHIDTGDFVVVINADKFKVTGNKLAQKRYYHHTGYPGGIKDITLEKLLVRHPTRAIELAVKGMMPKGPLGRAMLKKLKIYSTSEHPHAANQPEILEL